MSWPGNGIANCPTITTIPRPTGLSSRTIRPSMGTGSRKRKKRPKSDFAMLKEFAFKLKPAEFLTYGAMLYLYGWKKQCVVITNEDIRNLTGLSKRTIMRAQNNLVEKGFLKRYRTPHKKGALWWVSKNKGDIMRHIDPDVLFGDLTGQNGTTSDDLTGSEWCHLSIKTPQTKRKEKRRQ